jgi:aryl carrier-like protein
MNLAEQIRLHILQESLPGESPDALSADDDLIESGVLDSLAVMQLVGWLEKTHLFAVEPGEITAAHFGSATRLAAFVRTKKNLPPE